MYNQSLTFLNNRDTLLRIIHHIKELKITTCQNLTIGCFTSPTIKTVVENKRGCDLEVNVTRPFFVDEISDETVPIFLDFLTTKPV